jgi:hypothetical protein
MAWDTAVFARLLQPAIRQWNRLQRAAGLARLLSGASARRSQSVLQRRPWNEVLVGIGVIADTFINVGSERHNGGGALTRSAGPQTIFKPAGHPRRALLCAARLNPNDEKTEFCAGKLS